jgi:ABC-type uncharacterized transport system substrate-binding protein
VTEIRFADGDPSRLSTLVAELLRLKVDLIVSNSTEVIQIVRETSKSMPLVMSTISDPLGSGLIASLAQPGGNITGLSLYSTELSGKRLELMKEAFPQVKHVDLMVLRDHPPTRLLISEMKSAARALNLTMKAFEIASSNDYEKIFSTIDRVRSSALFVQNNTVFHRTFSTITRLATKHRLLTVGSSIGLSRRAVLWLTAQTKAPCGAARRCSLTRSSKAPSRLIFPSSNRLSLRWRSISKQRSRLD